MRSLNLDKNFPLQYNLEKSKFKKNTKRTHPSKAILSISLMSLIDAKAIPLNISATSKDKPDQ